MYAVERQQVILEQARARGRVDVAALAEELTVTTETIRRDLTTLEHHGVLRRVHGGGIPVERFGFGPAVATSETDMTREKERIARAALSELPAEGSILLDAGTTLARMAELLPADREFTMVTHSLNIALSLNYKPNLTVMLIGGRLCRRTHTTVDAWALQALEGTYVDVAFIAAEGISVEHGLTTHDPAEAMVKRAAIASARRVVLLADHTKVGNDYFARFAALSDIDTFMTDTAIDTTIARQISEAGPNVVAV